MEQAAQEKITQLQFLEQNMHSVLNQKQTLQSQELELTNALEELEKSTGTTYKILGPIMISSNKVDLQKNLQLKKEMVDIRLKKVEEQESQIKEKIEAIQKDVFKDLKNGTQ